MATAAVFVILLAIALASLAPAWILGRAGPGSGRAAAAWAAAVAMNLAASIVPLAGYAAMFLCAAACFAIAAAVGGVAGRRAWLFGSLACPWFLLPSLIHWVATASPDQVAAYGRVPVGALLMITPFGLAGALAASATLSVRDAVRPQS